MGCEGSKTEENIKTGANNKDKKDEKNENKDKKESNNNAKKKERRITNLNKEGEDKRVFLIFFYEIIKMTLEEARYLNNVIFSEIKSISKKNDVKETSFIMKKEMLINLKNINTKSFLI